MDKIAFLASHPVGVAWTVLWALLAVPVASLAGDHAPALLALLPLAGAWNPLAEPDAAAPVVRGVVAALGGFVFFFLTAYLGQGLLDALRLTLVGRRLERLVQSGRAERRDWSPEDELWPQYPRFTRLWQNFSTSLLPRPRPGVWPGEERVVFRTSAAASVFFNRHTLVDAPMGVAFFRHLPGILVGIGVAGAFAGILWGIGRFDPTVAPDQVAAELGHLVRAVHAAFVAAFAAVATALLVTVAEKALLHWRYGQVDALGARLEQLFPGQAHTDFLDELVRTGGDRPRETVREAPPPAIDLQSLAAPLEQAIRSSLAEPLKVISQAVRAALTEREPAPETLDGPTLRDIVQASVGDLARHLDETLERALAVRPVAAPEPSFSTLAELTAELARGREELTARLEAQAQLLARQGERNDQMVNLMEHLLERGRANGAGLIRVHEELARDRDQGRRMIELLEKLVRMAREAGEERSARSGRIEKLLADLAPPSRNGASEPGLTEILQRLTRAMEQEQGGARTWNDAAASRGETGPGGR
ncbi:MAG: hypothetical protein HQL82_15230 [Magnetococcales bacterium]|nr:hypothetical protein [Magnetococcales bacterium]